MNITKCRIRGERRFKVDTTTNGRRKRQFFRTWKQAQAGLAAAQRQQRAVGRAFDLLSAREKARIMSTIQEIEQAGLTLTGVWQTARSIPNAPRVQCTLRQAVGEVLAAKRSANRRPRYLKNLEWYLNLFIRGRETADVSAIGEQELNEWFDARQESPSTKKPHVSLLATLFDHCWRRRYIAENPVKRLEPVYVDRNSPVMLTPRQCARAILWARRRKPQMLAWLTLALFCGLRPESEADSIDWKAIDLKHARIVIAKSKVRHVAHRIIDLSFCPPALKWLWVAKAIHSPLPLKHITRRRYLRALRDYLRFKRWPQDVLRHTAASNLLAFHQDAGKVAAFLGHSAGILLRHYKALVFREDADAWMRIMPKKRQHP